MKRKPTEEPSCSWTLQLCNSRGYKRPRIFGVFEEAAVLDSTSVAWIGGLYGLEVDE